MTIRPVCELRPQRWASVGVLLVLALLWHLHPFAVLRRPREQAESLSDAAPLDMAADSVDDMYEGCWAEASSVIHLLAVFEWHFNRNFSVAWASAERHAKKPAHEQLRDEHAVAMYLYTGAGCLRQRFDEAVKTGKHKYSTDRFMFHYWYFFLTDSVQVLRENQTSCSVAYHRTRTRFSRDLVNAHVRFGAFTLAGATQQSFQFHGNVSCFEIHTCFGADITHYAATDEMGQVLIPPYEVFRITDVRTDDLWCSVVYKLQSTQKPRADLNCGLSSWWTKTYSGLDPSHWPGSFGKMLTCVMLLLIISLVLVKQKQKGFVAAVLGSLLMLMITAVIWRKSQNISQK